MGEVPIQYRMNLRMFEKKKKKPTKDLELIHVDKGYEQSMPFCCLNKSFFLQISYKEFAQLERCGRLYIFVSFSWQQKNFCAGRHQRNERPSSSEGKKKKKKKIDILVEFWCRRWEDQKTSKDDRQQTNLNTGNSKLKWKGPEQSVLTLRKLLASWTFLWLYLNDVIFDVLCDQDNYLLVSSFRNHCWMLTAPKYYQFDLVWFFISTKLSGSSTKCNIKKIGC